MKRSLNVLLLLCACTAWSMDHDEAQSQKALSSSEIQTEAMNNFWNLLCKHRGTEVSDAQIEDTAQAILSTIIESHKPHNTEETSANYLKQPLTQSKSSSSSSSGLSKEESQMAGRAIVQFVARHINNPSLDPYASKPVKTPRPIVDILNGVAIAEKNEAATFALAKAMQDGTFTDERVRKLLEEGAHPNPRYRTGSCCTYEDLLVHAIDKGASYNCVAMLLNAGADDDKTHVALYTAARKVRPDLVQLLLERGYLPDEAKFATALHACWQKQDKDMHYHYQVQEKESSDPRIEDRLEITRILLKWHCDPTKENACKKIAAQLAQENYSIDIQPLIEEAYVSNAINDISTLFIEDQKQYSPY